MGNAGDLLGLSEQQIAAWQCTSAEFKLGLEHAGHSVAMFRDKFWLCLALTVPVVFWSNEVQHWPLHSEPKRSYENCPSAN